MCNVLKIQIWLKSHQPSLCFKHANFGVGIEKSIMGSSRGGINKSTEIRENDAERIDAKHQKYAHSGIMPIFGTKLRARMC